MRSRNIVFRTLTIAAGAALVIGMSGGIATATEPCGDFGECKALIEINASDGDIGFHFLMDGDDLNSARIDDPNGAKVFEDQAKGPLREQKLTETFAESAEPLCWPDPEADPDWLSFEGRWMALFAVNKLAGNADIDDSQDLDAGPAGS